MKRLLLLALVLHGCTAPVDEPCDSSGTAGVTVARDSNWMWVYPRDTAPEWTAPELEQVGCLMHRILVAADRPATVPDHYVRVTAITEESWTHGTNYVGWAYGNPAEIEFREWTWRSGSLREVCHEFAHVYIGDWAHADSEIWTTLQDTCIHDATFDLVGHDIREAARLGETVRRPSCLEPGARSDFCWWPPR